MAARTEHDGDLPPDTRPGAEATGTGEDFSSKETEVGVDLGEIRWELEETADEVARLTDEIITVSERAERMELVVGDLMSLITEPMILVGDAGRVMAASQGAFDHYPGITPEILGQPASDGLPPKLASAILNVGRTGGPRQAADFNAPDPLPRPWVTLDEGKVVPLPGGWALAVLKSA